MRRVASIDWYRLDRRALMTLRAVGVLPPAWRGVCAERWLRRPGVPGPAAEHVLQYVLSAATPARRPTSDASKASVVKQADLFYRAQYRQYLSAAMGAFAMTAPQFLAAAGTAPRGSFLRQRRRTATAMFDTQRTHGVLPVVVSSRESVALAVFLPAPSGAAERDAVDSWLQAAGPMPAAIRCLVDGEPVEAEPSGCRTLERPHAGSRCELLDAAVRTGRLALLALHPYDPDAMGLHITLFGVQAVDADRLEAGQGLPSGTLDPYRRAAAERGELLYFLAGGTGEVFTQCSQNLFTKSPVVDGTATTLPGTRSDDRSRPRLGDLVASQFELLQCTVDSTGLPGASPRNGQIGKAAFLGRHRRRSYLLIPYHPGNAIHGHAAKLWSNRWSSVVISDDHDALRRVTVSGPSWTASHRSIRSRFPDAARCSVEPEPGVDRPVAEPVYWFVTRVQDVVWELEPLPANALTEERATCTIHAGGQGRHSKKAAYFDAVSVAAFDQHLQHEREAAGGPTDPSGAAHLAWQQTVGAALERRTAQVSLLGPGAGAGTPAT